MGEDATRRRYGTRRLALKRGSIATRAGDGGETGVAGGGRLAKGDLRVEAYGTIDELNATIGFARAICDDAVIAGALRSIQRELFAVGAAISSTNAADIPEITAHMVATLDALVEQFEAEPGVVRDWSIPGEHRASAALEVARAVARRADRRALPNGGRDRRCKRARVPQSSERRLVVSGARRGSARGHRCAASRRRASRPTVVARVVTKRAGMPTHGARRISLTPELGVRRAALLRVGDVE